MSSVYDIFLIKVLEDLYNAFFKDFKLQNSLFILCHIDNEELFGNY